MPKYYEIGCFKVKTMSFHARLKQTDDVRVVRILSKAETTAVVHEFSELLGLVFAELFNRNFLLLFLDVGVLFLLRSSW